MWIKSMDQFFHFGPQISQKIFWKYINDRLRQTHFFCRKIFFGSIYFVAMVSVVILQKVSCKNIEKWLTRCNLSNENFCFALFAIKDFRTYFSNLCIKCGLYNIFTWFFLQTPIHGAPITWKSQNICLRPSGGLNMVKIARKCCRLTPGRHFSVPLTPIYPKICWFLVIFINFNYIWTY